MKILHVTTVTYVLFFFTSHFDFLAQHGNEIHVVSSPDPELSILAKQVPVHVHPLAISRSPNIPKDILSFLGLVRIFRRIRPDLVHLTTPKVGLLGTLASRTVGIKSTVLSVFGLVQMTKTGFTKHYLDFTTRLACSLADLVWCDSPSIRQYVIDQKLSHPDKTIVLGYGSVAGTDTKTKFNPANYQPTIRYEIRNRCNIPTDSIVLGYVGRIVRDKGIQELTEAWKRLRSKHENLYLLFVGPLEVGDPIREEDLLFLQNDPRVRFVGKRFDVAEHLSAMDIFINPSYREGFGIANIEASAMELPVVATKIPGCVDSVADGFSGTLVPPRDANALASAIEAYILNPDLRLLHGRQGRERTIRDFSPERLQNALWKEYQRLHARNPRI